MLGVIVNGKPVLTGCTQIGINQYIITVGNVDNVNHLFVFLTTANLFPPGYVGLIYFSWPEPNVSPTWHLIGCLTNEKLSALLKISDVKRTANGPNSSVFGQQPICREAQVGLSIETIDVMNQQMSLLEASKPDEETQFASFSQKMVKSFVNFASSFSQTPNQVPTVNPNVFEGVVPFSILQNWHQTFLRRLSTNPLFWQ